MLFGAAYLFIYLNTEKRNYSDYVLLNKQNTIEENEVASIYFS